MMDLIDVELFIDEIRKRPFLWDTSSADYSNRQMKKDKWTEICVIISPDFLQKSESDQIRIGKDIQMKWRHIRDAYVRHRRLAARKRSGTGHKIVKSYIYAKQLHFLENMLEPPQTETSWVPEHKLNYNADEHTNDNVADDPLDNRQGTAEECTSNQSLTVPVRMEKKGLEDRLISYINVPEKKTVEHQQHHKEIENDDMSFFKSLLPTLQPLRPEQKLTFRIDVMKLLAEYYKSSK